MKLNYQIFGDKGSPLIIVHGLFGSIANWRSVARELEKDFTVYLVDQRNHGNSGHTKSMTYEDMASDLNEFISEQQISNFILCGHSMGGKAAMTYALSDFLSAEKMDKLIVLDIAPVVYTHSHTSYLQAMSAIDLSMIQSRSDADKQLKSEIPDNATRLFLMQSLEHKDGNYRWKLNLPVLMEYMDDIVGFPDDMLLDKRSEIETLFLHGSQSDYVREDMCGAIKKYFLNSKYATVEAGHWLHVEQRDDMIEEIKKFIF